MSDVNAKTNRRFYICDVCAERKKLTTKYPTGGNTLCMVECDWCGKEDSFCAPIVDFKQSGDKSWD